MRGQFTYITGADGTGKTTQAKLLIERLESAGVPCKHLWLRFPFFLSLPLLAYARWKGYSWHEVTDGVDHGYWDFRNSWVLRFWLPWTLLVDAALASMSKVYLPLWMGKTIVCERFVYDMLVDLAVAFDEFRVCMGLPGNIYRRLLPRRSCVIVLDLDTETIRLRRADLRRDRRLPRRLELFRRLAEESYLPVISTLPAKGCVSDRLWTLVRDGD